MDEFTPPTGPPPPKVPEGWKAIWNAQYSEWFYVNIYTKTSQWDKPTEPIYPPGETPHGVPPSYPPAAGGPGAPPLSADKTGLSSNNPYASAPSDTTEDERLARQLQAEEDARVHNQGRPLSNPGGASNAYYGVGAPPLGGGTYAAPPPGTYAGQQPNQQPDPYTGAYGDSTADKGKHKSGLAGKAVSLLSKLKSGGSGARPGAHQQHGGMYGAQPGYGQQQQQHGGYYPPHGRPMMGGGHGGMMGGGGRKPGMGAGGAMALGGLGGLAGGALLGSAMAGDDGGDYGGGYGGDDGGDYGGGDYGGGDFGGGDGGGGDGGGGGGD